MDKLIIVKTGKGDFARGFPVTLQIWTETVQSREMDVELTAELPPNLDIKDHYSSWWQNCFPTPTISLNKAKKQLRDSINNWLKSSQFLSPWSRLLRNCTSDDRVRVIWQTDDLDLQQFPWYILDFFDDYPLAEVAVSSAEGERVPRQNHPTGRVKILGILGSDKGINIATDRRLIEGLPDIAPPTFLVKPGRQDLNDRLWERQMDILFFAGHSERHESSGSIEINDTESLTVDDLRYGLQKAIAGGLQVAIFNSCQGLGLARDLADLHIPVTIVMREPVRNRVAQEFLKYFLTAYARDRETLYLAVREARRKLQGLETQFPGASWLPVIYQNIAARPPTWNDLQGNLQGNLSAGQHVAIAYLRQEPDMTLAQDFEQYLTAAGYQAFLAGESPDRLEAQLQRCDYLLLLLSSRSASSEMVTEEIRRVKELQSQRTDGKPGILPIRVNFPLHLPLNYEQRGYLHGLRQWEWQCESDTAAILQEVIQILASDRMPPPQLYPITYPIDSIAITDYPPLPVAEPELPDGQVELASRFYVERPPIESRCYQAIARPGALIRIKAPRQMGKTSLMARILHYVAGQGDRTVSLSFQLANSYIFADHDRFLQWFCASIGMKLNLPDKLADYWSVILGSNFSCTTYFEQYLLPQTDRPVTLVLDEVDRVFQYREIADDFLGMLRAWHEEGKNSDIWRRLRLVVVHSTEVYIPLNINQSPFNVGLPIELPEFTIEQVRDLAGRYGLNWKETQVQALIQMVGGHPYLVRVALYHIARQDITLDRLLQIAPTEAGLYGDHMRWHLWNLLQHPELAGAMKKVVNSTAPLRLESVQGFKLHSMGLIHLQGNEVIARCDLYSRYLRDRL